MWRLPRLPVGAWMGWIVLALCCAWAAVGLLLYVDPLMDGLSWQLDEATGRTVAENSPLGLYYARDDEFTLRSDIAVIRRGFTIDAFTAVAFAALGAVLLDRDPRNRAGWFCAVMALLAPVGDILCGLLPDAFAEQWARWVDFPLGLLVPTVLILILPNGRVSHRFLRPVLWLMVGWIATWSVLRQLPGQTQYVASDFVGDVPAPGAPGAVLAFLRANYLFLLLASLLAAVVRIVLSRGPSRRVALFVVAGTIVYSFTDQFIITAYGLPNLSAVGVSDSAYRAIMIVSGVALPVACVVGVLRYGDPAPRRRVVRAVEYAVLAVVVAVLYLAMNVTIPDRPGGMVLKIELMTEPIRMTVTAVVVALLAPSILRWLRGGVTRLVWGRRGSPDDVVAALGRRLADACTPEDVLTVLADAAHRALCTGGVRVALESCGRELRSVTVGSVAGRWQATVELGFQGVDLGRMEVAADHPIDDRTGELLRDLAAAASTALAAGRRSAELQQAREQLVAAREQERRRIARDLHDGVGPVLSGLGFTLDALRANVRDDPAAERVATQAREQVRAAGQLVRRVAKALRPAGVDQLGLVGALCEIVAWHDSPRLAVALDIDGPGGGVGELSAATEVAAYAIVAEAITNAARHADARHCRVELRRADRSLTVQVSDDGVGIGAGVAGLGLRTMRERAEELGGSWAVETPPGGGTRVTAVLPLAPDPGAEPTTMHPVLSVQP